MPYNNRGLNVIMPGQDHPEGTPSQEELKILAQDLIHEQSTMAIATAKDNMAWTAPVYYVLKNPSFYFFSDPKSRHIQESQYSNQASASIYPFVSTWREIKGIQMSGHIEPLLAGLEAIQVIRAYLKKFPFTKDFFEPGQSVNLKTFRKRFKVRLYRFSPDLVYYLDNRVRFGFRAEIKL